MRSPEEIKKALKICALREDNECKDCPYQGEAHCVDVLMLDALRYIEQLESAPAPEAAPAPAPAQSGLPKWWIEVTDEGEKPCYVNTGNIYTVCNWRSEAHIVSGDLDFAVKESLEEVMQKIREATT